MKSKMGLYKVNHLYFDNKIKAVLYANETKADITWSFNPEILKKINWTKEPEDPLTVFYKRRAEQIRQEYDYIILMCSGGADSTNMLQSFLDHNIYVDEIMAGAPLSGMKNFLLDQNDTSPENTVAETIITQLPLMNSIKQKFPSIKITIHDYFEDILNTFNTKHTDEWIYLKGCHWLHWSGSARHSLDKFAHIKDLAEKGKRVAVVYGIDKPVLCRYDNGDLYSVIADSVAQMVSPHFYENYPNVDTVLFYYTPDLPGLMIKQAHELARWIHTNEGLKAKTFMWDTRSPPEIQGNYIRSGSWQRSIIPCIYPTINHSKGIIWQAKKQESGFIGGLQIDYWMVKNHSATIMMDMFNSDLQMFISKIDKKYLDIKQNKIKGFKRFFDYWKIGHESQFFPKETDNDDSTMEYSLVL